MAGSVACVCVGAAEVTVVETVWLAPLLVSVSVQTDRLTEVTELRWLMHAREVIELSEVTVGETLWLPLLLVPVLLQTD